MFIKVVPFLLLLLFLLKSLFLVLLCRLRPLATVSTNPLSDMSDVEFPVHLFRTSHRQAAGAYVLLVGCVCPCYCQYLCLLLLLLELVSAGRVSFDALSVTTTVFRIREADRSNWVSS